MISVKMGGRADHPGAEGGQLPWAGAVLRQYRLAAGLTQEQAAERAGLSRRTVAALEGDREGSPRRETLLLLSTALGLSAWEQEALLAAAWEAGDAAAAVPLARPGQRADVGPPLQPFSGRREVLGRIEAHLRGRGPPLILLTGEPGIGKTRLLREVARRAVAAGWTVLHGGCSRRGGQEPYAPLLEALQRHLSAQEPFDLRRTLEGCAWLVQLLPELADGPIPPLPAQTLPEDQQRRLMAGAVQRYLGNVAGPAGTLLLLDDLQWAGRDALDLLSVLLRAADRHPEGPRLRVVGACRDTEVGDDHPLATLLADLAPAGLKHREPLGPLSPREAAALLAALLPEEDEAGQELAERILERAEGVPFFLVSYAQELRGARGEGDWVAVPWDLRRSLQQQVAGLGAHAQDLLAAAAVIGREVDPGLLQTVTGLPEDALVAGLDEAYRARLLTEHGGGYQFAHDVIREVVEAELGPAHRAALHRKVAEALERQGERAPAERVAHHYLRSDAPDEALSFLERAGDGAERQHAHAAAEAQYRELLDRLHRLGREEDAGRVRLKLGRVLLRTGRHDAALDVLEEAAPVFQTRGDAESLARVTVEIGEAHLRRGTPVEGVARMQALGEHLTPTASRGLLAPVYETLAHGLLDAGRAEEALAASTRALELAEASGDRRTAILAEWGRAHSHAALGRISSTEAMLVRKHSLPQVEALGDLALLARTQHNVAYLSAVLGDLDAARSHIDRAIAAAEELGDPWELALAVAVRGWLRFLTGEWRGARADLEHALALNRTLEHSWYAPYPLLWLARLCLAQGDHPAAAAYGEEATAQAERTGDLQARRWAAAVLAELEVLEGRPEAAIARLAPLLEGGDRYYYDAAVCLPLLARAYVEQGQLGQAAETLESVLARARRDGARLVLTEGLRVQAMVSMRREEWEAAERSLQEGLTTARSMGYPYAEAQLRSLQGQVLAARGERARGRERWQEALAIFRRLGAAREAQQIEAALSHRAPPQHSPPASSKPTPAAPSGGQPMGEARLTDAQWVQIAALLPSRPGGRGRPRADDRRTLEAILHVQRTGCHWSDLPPELGDDATANRRLQEWRRAGIWEQITELAQPPESVAGEEREADPSSTSLAERGT